MNLNFTSIPILTTDRLLLRALKEEDFEAIHQLHSDPIVNAFVGRANVSTLENAKAYILKMDNLINKKECLYWAITSKKDQKFLGSVCLWNFDTENEIVEIGYELLSEFQSKGYMSEALKAVIEFTFNTMKADLITAFPSEDNIGSVSILKKLGFIFDEKPYNNKHENVKNITTYILKSS
ncbi:MAG: GNAT family N-acetyltransferase [Flavobacterium sp.]|uniref:GNAT family N-acetyltransferase n=1 Tax=Flavobacterium sp. TaxID=239 RepID=UPI001B2A2A98|nr:GNAT family N-acetyltransferase [Flavobacterium sp.]MBO9584773.1 GNAT family N-acetyltransferase [Flavobacterium sp.]